MSSYYLRTLSFLGVILVWCTYPILVTLNVYNSSESQIIAMSGQVNMWLALAGSVLGCYTASSYVYRKFCVHDMVYAAFTVRFQLFRELSHIHLALSLTITLEQRWRLAV